MPLTPSRLDVAGSGSPSGVSHCQTCEAVIVWYRTAQRNRPMPVDYEPPPVIVDVFDGWARIRAVSHVATCQMRAP